MLQHQLDVFTGDAKKVKINNEVYQIQPVEYENEIFFFVRHLNKVICMVLQDEKDEWMPDCDINQELFEQIMKRINKLYFPMKILHWLMYAVT